MLIIFMGCEKAEVEPDVRHYNLPSDQFVKTIKAPTIGHISQKYHATAHWDIQFIKSGFGMGYHRVRLIINATNKPYNVGVGAISLTIDCDGLDKSPTYNNYFLTNGCLVDNIDPNTGEFKMAWWSITPLPMNFIATEIFRFNVYKVVKIMPVNFVTVPNYYCEIGTNGMVSYNTKWINGVIMNNIYTK